MAAPRGQTPPVNLKERIAALQQRSVSPNTHQSAQAVPRGLPSPGSGGLRDKIAKFEEKGGMPVPRGSFAMGAPQLAENAPPKKRGELYGNRVPGLGRPSGAPVSRSGSPLPSTDEPGPRKRCISTGTGLSSAPFTFPTDEPVPPLPNGLSATAPRRNSLAVNFVSGRRVMSTSDADGRTVDMVDASSFSQSFVVPEKPPEVTEPQSPDSEPSSPANEPPSASLETPEDIPETSEQPLEEQPIPTDAGTSKVDTPEADPPGPTSHTFPSLHDVSRDVSEPCTAKDELSEYASLPQPAISQPIPSLPDPASPVVPTDTLSVSVTPTLTPTPAVTVVATLPPEKATKPVDTSRDSTITIFVPESTVPDSPSIATPTPTAETCVQQSKPTFKAVVHRKVTAATISAPSSLAPPETPLTKQRQGVNGNVVEVPPSSPGYDLAVLLEDAALLELRLTEGDGTGLKARDLAANTPTSATFQTDPRHASASTLTEHVPVPSSDGSQSVRSMSIPSIREPLIDGEIPEGDETDGRSLASTTFSQRSPSHRKYLSNIYRLTGRRSSSYMPGAYPRDSMSMSSEDSSPVTTPSDNGKRKGFGIAWPSASPKKGSPNVSRSSSFADKIFHRNRTKSNVSTADQALDRRSLYESSQPNLTIAFPPELSPESHRVGVDIGARPTSWMSPGDSNPEFSPESSPLDKDIFDAFPSVPQTLPPGFHLDAENGGVGRASTLPVGRKQVGQRLAMMNGA